MKTLPVIIYLSAVSLLIKSGMSAPARAENKSPGRVFYAYPPPEAGLCRQLRHKIYIALWAAERVKFLKVI